jgi:lysophospholipase L1-like esterase
MRAPTHGLDRRVGAGLAAIGLGLPASLAVVLALVTKNRVSWQFAAGLLLLAAAGLLLVIRKSRAASRLLVMLVTASVLVVWPEFALRVSGFAFDPRGVIQFGYPRPDTLMNLVEDVELFWKLPLTNMFVNPKGFWGDDFEIPKPPLIWRIMFLGDSCSQQGYPFRVTEVLNERIPSALRFETINMAVSGYTSYQGRVLAEQWASKLEPDAAVIYFGWNDHWQAYGSTDSQRAKQRFTRTSAFRWLLTSSRIVQAIAYLSTRGSSQLLAVPRVPVDEYRANLVRMGTLVENAGGRVVLLTAPSTHRTLGVPDYLIAEGFAASKETVLQWHRQYNEEVRRVANEHGWLLLDLEARVDQMRTDPTLIFRSDGIHYTNAGIWWLGVAVAEFIEQEILRKLPASPVEDHVPGSPLHGK